MVCFHCCGSIVMDISVWLQNLFKLHRDWYFHVPGRPRQVGRNQMVLDLSRKDVRDYLFVTIGDILCK